MFKKETRCFLIVLSFMFLMIGSVFSQPLIGNLIVKYGENRKYGPDTTGMIDAGNEIIKIKADNVSCSYCDAALITIRLTNKRDVPVPNKQILVSFASKTDTFIKDATTDANGKLSFNFTQNLKPGKYLIRAKAPSDRTYRQNLTTFTLTVNRLNATISMKNINGVYGRNCTLIAILHNKTKVPKGIPIFGQNITFSYAGTNITIASGDVSFNGTYSYDFPCPNPGKFNITAKSEGNEFYNPTNTTIVLDIRKYRTKIQMDDIRGYKGMKVNLTAHLTKELTGESLANMRIMFYGVNNEEIGIARTNSEGNATIEYKIPVKSGSYIVQSTFLDEGTPYSSSNGVANLVVEKNRLFTNLWKRWDLSLPEVNFLEIFNKLEK